MPNPPGLVRVTVSGTLQGGEQVVHTLHGRAAADAGPVAGGLQEIANTVRDRWTSMLTTPVTIAAGNAVPSGQLHTDMRYVMVQAYLLDANGKSTDQAAAQFGATAKGTAANGLPHEVAMAISTITSRAGRTGRGRFYLGGIAAGALMPDGRYRSDATDTFAVAFRDMFQALNNPGAGQFRACVLSRTTGTISNIREIRVGDVPDVQRRRRNRIRETYASRALTS